MTKQPLLILNGLECIMSHPSHSIINGADLISSTNGSRWNLIIDYGTDGPECRPSAPLSFTANFQSQILEPSEKVPDRSCDCKRASDHGSLSNGHGNRRRTSSSEGRRSVQSGREWRLFDIRSSLAPAASQIPLSQERRPPLPPPRRRLFSSLRGKRKTTRRLRSFAKKLV